MILHQTMFFIEDMIRQSRRSFKKRVRWFLVLGFVLPAISGAAPSKFEIQKEYNNFVSLPNGRSLFVRWSPPQNGRESIVLVNGLTYSTSQWYRMADALIRKGYGVLRYDMQGMGETLRKAGMPTDKISYRDQVEDLNQLTQQLGLPQKLNLVGLSYGGGISLAFAGIYPERVSHLFAMAPYTEALKSQDQWIRSQVALNRWQFPLNPATDDELYDYFLRQIVYLTYPSSEPVVLEQPFKLEATFRMVQGIRQWRADSISQQLPPRSVHFMIAGNDQYIPRSVLEDFWATVPTSSKASKIVISQSEHKIPEAVPQFAANWISYVLSKGSQLNSELEYLGVPVTGAVISGSEKFNIGSEFGF